MSSEQWPKASHEIKRALPTDVRWWLRPTGQRYIHFFGLRPFWGVAPDLLSLTEGHRPSAHQAA